MDDGLMRAGELLVFGAVLHCSSAPPVAVLLNISIQQRRIDASTNEQRVMSLSVDDISCVQSDMKNAKLLTIYMPTTRPIELELNSVSSL